MLVESNSLYAYNEQWVGLFCIADSEDAVNTEYGVTKEFKLEI